MIDQTIFGLYATVLVVSLFAVIYGPLVFVGWLLGGLWGIVAITLAVAWSAWCGSYLKKLLEKWGIPMRERD
jgi:hypothetical protein